MEGRLKRSRWWWDPWRWGALLLRGASDRARWWWDPWLWGALLLGFVLRVAPMVAWGTRGCSRDECSYKVLARAIARGDGLEPHNGWLWAPGYPYLLAWFEYFGSVWTVKRYQVALALVTAVLLYRLTQRLFGLRAGRWAAFLFALHPTLAFFAGTIWTESVYTFLLVAAVSTALWARDGGGERAVVPGLLVGLAVLFRGVALPLGPVVLVGLLWPWRERWREALRRRAVHAVAFAAVAIGVVLPWSLHATRTHGGVIVSDATLGQVIYIGNSDFPLVTYDLGNGLLPLRTWRAYYDKARPRCDLALPAAQWNRCEVENGLEWIRDNPDRFVARVPKRWAQLLNPNSFLTRHVRTAKWPGLPWWAKEGLTVWVIATSLLVAIGGTVGAWARGRGPYAALAVGVVLYHLVVIGALFGMTRFRVPLEPLWIVFLAPVLAQPAETWAALRGHRGRMTGAVLTLAALIPLLLWYLPTGFPQWWR